MSFQEIVSHHVSLPRSRWTILPPVDWPPDTPGLVVVVATWSAPALARTSHLSSMLGAGQWEDIPLYIVDNHTAPAPLKRAGFGLHGHAETFGLLHNGDLVLCDDEVHAICELLVHIEPIELALNAGQQVREPVSAEMLAGAGGEYLRFAMTFDYLLGSGPDEPEFVRTRRWYYNYLYWFHRFVEARIVENGPDAGLEQQAHALLAHAPKEVDWSVVEQLLRLARKGPCAFG